MENIIAFAKDEVMMECGYCVCLSVSLCLLCLLCLVCVSVSLYLITPLSPPLPNPLSSTHTHTHTHTPSSAPLGDDGV